jgi:hypothetical protein
MLYCDGGTIKQRIEDRHRSLGLKINTKPVELGSKARRG